ncbi:MAG TPA: hypothetical protein PLP03_08260 [Bacteroidales bacterium]|nr:hypothetical protein [Bacteroidales bacterium]
MGYFNLTFNDLLDRQISIVGNDNGGFDFPVTGNSDLPDLHQCNTSGVLRTVCEPPKWQFEEQFDIHEFNIPYY